jgi:hypothetical protein
MYISSEARFWRSNRACYQSIILLYIFPHTSIYIYIYIYIYILAASSSSSSILAMKQLGLRAHVNVFLTSTIVCVFHCGLRGESSQLRYITCVSASVSYERRSPRARRLSVCEHKLTPGVYLRDECLQRWCSHDDSTMVYLNKME